MANSGWVKSRKTISPGLISEMLDEMNNNLFKGNLEIEYHVSTPEAPSWGEHTWLLRYMSQNQEWASRVCWLENSRKFQMRHGGGPYFAWWIDSAILNEVAVRVNGTIYDDGDDRKTKGEPGKYDSFRDYLNHTLSHIRKPGVIEQILEQEKAFIPEEFHDCV